MKKIILSAGILAASTFGAFAEGAEVSQSMVEGAAASSIGDGTGVSLMMLFLLILGATVVNDA